MANRFPLIVDSSGTPQIEELPSGDNLDLTGSGITGATNIAATAVSVGGAALGNVSAATLANLSDVHTASPTAGQFLGWDNSNSRWAPTSPAAADRWTKISSTTVSSEVFAVEFTGISGYDEYQLVMSDMLTGNGHHGLGLTFDYGSGYPSTGFRYGIQFMGNTSASLDYHSSSGDRNFIPITYYDANHTGNNRAPGFGQIEWTKYGSSLIFECLSYWSVSADYGMQWFRGGASNYSYERTAPTKVKLSALTSHAGTTNFPNASSGVAQTSVSGEGIVSGTYTLYGLTV